MFTNHEIEVLEKYLQWSKVIFSSKQKKLQDEIMGSVAELKRENPEKRRVVIDYNMQLYAFDLISNELFLISQLESEIINLEGSDLDKIVNLLENKYSKNEIIEVFNNLNN